MESITKIIANLEKNVSDLQRDNEGLKQAVLNVSTSVEGLSRKVSMLEEALEKLEKVMGRFTNKNEQEDIMFVMTLGDKVLIKSIVEHKFDSIQSGIIKGSEINETK